MKKSFSLLEIIIVIVIISIITTYFLTKSESLIDKTVEVKIKSEIALIRDSITKTSSSSILLGKSKLSSLDEESVNKIDSKLFSNVLDMPLLSSSLEEKKISKWIKTGSNLYRVYLSKDIFLDFKFDSDSFLCVSDIDLCKEYE